MIWWALLYAWCSFGVACWLCLIGNCKEKCRDSTLGTYVRLLVTAIFWPIWALFMPFFMLWNIHGVSLQVLYIRCYYRGKYGSWNTEECLRVARSRMQESRECVQAQPYRQNLKKYLNLKKKAKGKP